MNERFKFTEQEVGHKIWTIVQLFYRSLLVFREQYDSYEATVKEFAERRNTPREVLRLNSRDLATLLDFKKLERLRDRYIHELKDLCHQVFRGQDQTDLLDRYVADIFHEISILKEEHYNVKTYAPLYERDAREVELRGILDEAHQGFPKLMHHILYLFRQAQGRMEEHLASFRYIPIFMRSLYLHRNDFVAEVYSDGLRHFYRLMYPLGALEGFFHVGLSFFYSGFMEYAREAFLKAMDAHRVQVMEGDILPGTQRKRDADAMVLSIRKKAERIASVEGVPLTLAPAAESEFPTSSAFAEGGAR